jgi:hypothetical protein
VLVGIIISSVVVTHDEAAWGNARPRATKERSAHDERIILMGCFFQETAYRSTSSRYLMDEIKVEPKRRLRRVTYLSAAHG